MPGDETGTVGDRGVYPPCPPYKGKLVFTTGPEKRGEWRQMATKRRWLLRLLIAISAVDLAAIIVIGFTYPENERILMLVAALAMASCIGAMVHITVRTRRTEETFQQTMYMDALTGLVNGEGFNVRARHLLERADRGEYAIIDFDINFFERFNSLYGHEAGDELLKHIAQVLKAKSGKDKLFARIEADHFVCLTRCANETEAVALVQKFDREIRPLKSGLSVLISYGIYRIEDNSEHVSVLRDRAIAAKRTVKGSYEQYIGIYDKQLHRRQMEDSELVGQMDKALKDGEFVPYFQPKYDTYTERIVGAEALVRWNRRVGEVTPPDRFIRLFEEKGLITKLDWYMFEMVCRQLAMLSEMEIEPVPISVNFSRAHLYEANFVKKLQEISDYYGISPELLEIEMTESMFFDDPAELYRMVAELHDVGFKISIDDFGSGYSSLNMLKDDCFDIIKLDKAFMDQSTSKWGRIIIRGILRLAHELGMETLAEGVTNREQLEFLKDSGCDLIQGYYFSKPVNADSFVQMLEQETEAKAMSTCV